VTNIGRNPQPIENLQALSQKKLKPLENANLQFSSFREKAHVDRISLGLLEDFNTAAIVGTTVGSMTISATVEILQGGNIFAAK